MTPPVSGNHPVLETRAIVKRFPGVLALDRVDFQVHAGEVHGLIGENGAGKSTLMHLLVGAQQPGNGQILLDGRRVEFADTREALDARISIVYQELILIPYLTVAENVFLGRELRSATGWINSKEQNRRCRELLDRLDPTIDPRAEVESLRVGQQQIVVLAKVLSAQPRVLLLDEPTRGIDVNAKREIYRLIDDLKRQGLAIVVVSSELPELLGIADRIMVMCEGRKTAEFDRHEATEEAVMRAAVPGVAEYA